MSAEYLKKRGVQISDEEMAKIDAYLEVFEAFDKDKNGYLNKKEVKNLLVASKLANSPTPKQIFALADEDGDGNISKEEFLFAIVGVSKETQMAYMFRSFDKDGDGKVDAKEVLAALGHQETPQNLKAAEDLIKQMDKDGDGRLDVEEFATMFTRKTVCGK